MGGERAGMRRRSGDGRIMQEGVARASQHLERNKTGV